MMMMIYNKDAIWRQSNGLTSTLWLDDDDDVDDDGDDDDRWKNYDASMDPKYDYFAKRVGRTDVGTDSRTDTPGYWDAMDASKNWKQKLFQFFE